MGVSFSCPLAAYCNLEDGLESAIVKSIFLDKDQEKTAMHAVNVSHQHSEFKTMEPLHSKSVKACCSLNEEIISQSPKPDITTVTMPQLSVTDSFSPKHEAAVKLQKVYKSFRTRRKLADCAVLIEQSWWKLLDFAELKHSSISFFEIDKHETAISRWSRARTRAAKVGKGLSKNGKAQKLALQHWLEAIDPRHRYGHNLHFYYVKWLHSQSKEPFFYWLDIGEGKEINLVEKCPRSKLQLQCIKYLGPMERKAYEVGLEDGILCYRETGELIDTTGEPKAKWIFVLSTSRILYIGKKKKGTFQHSSFLAGGAALAAGRIVVENGILKAAWPHSGHYRPTPENFQDFISFLKENNLELSDVKLDSTDEEDESLRRSGSAYLASTSSEDDLGEKHSLVTKEIDAEDSTLAKCNSKEEASAAAEILSKPSTIQCFGSKLTLEIPTNNDFIKKLQAENVAIQPDNDSFPPDSPTDAYETAEEIFASEEVATNLMPDMLSIDRGETGESTVSGELILEKINSTKGSKYYQLCGKWSSGAGPRIGILRDYPSELQSHALEQANLSPRSSCSPRFNLFSHTANGLSGESRRSPLVSSPRKWDLQLGTNNLGITQPSLLCKETTGTSSAD